MYQYELMCLSRECSGITIQKFKGLKDASDAIGTIVECPECGDEFEVTERHIFIREI